MSLDGERLFVADSAWSSESGVGAIVTVSSSGGDVTAVAGTEGTLPRGVVIAEVDDEEWLYFTGLDPESFSVTADFEIEGVAAGANLAARFQQVSQGVWELKLAQSIGSLEQGKLTVSVKDRQGNTSRIERTFSVAKAPK